MKVMRSPCPRNCPFAFLIMFDYFSFQLHSSADEAGVDVFYSISGVGVGSLFEVEAKSGKLYAIAELDREKRAKYYLRVSVLYDYWGR